MKTSLKAFAIKNYNALRFVVNVKALEPTIDKLRKSTHSHGILQLEIPMHAVEDAANQ